MPLKPKTITSRTKVTKGRIVSSSDGVVDARLKRKIEYVVEGLPSRCFDHLCKKVLPGSKENVLIICDYISSLKSEINPSNSYRKDTIILLCKFSYFLKNKTFKRVTRNDVLSYLDSFRKIETVDSLHKWIGTYNLYRIGLMRFFKWLYYPDIEQAKRPKPPSIENIPRLKRKEKSIYKPTDLWIPEDDLLFLKYCPSARDIPLIDSIPYIKDWISQHPQSGNPNSILLSGLVGVLEDLYMNQVFAEY